MTIKKNIIQVLKLHAPIKAREIARMLTSKFAPIDKKKVNSALYSMKPRKVVKINEKYEWSLDCIQKNKLEKWIATDKKEEKSEGRSKYRISKVLSANDTGASGAHQAGIHIPKDRNILGFFPALDNSTKNPRYNLPFYDDSGTRWEFAFIYYNNKLFGGTRNEFRLTRMTPFMRMNNLQPGDELIFELNSDGKRYIRYKRVKKGVGMGSDGILRLGLQWKVIDI